MDKENSLKIFENKNIRVYWDADEEKWYFSVVDIIFALTESKDPNDYWYKLKIRVNEESKIELSTICRQLKLLSKDGKKYSTDCADMKGILRIIQDIPSPKVEPLKMWLAQVGSERIDETYDPEIAINRALDTYRLKGYSEEWINQRLKSIDVRKEFTDELKRGGINESKDFAILTNILTKVWSGHDVKEYKQFKNLKKENLRDNMTNMEIVLNMLAETTSAEISKKKNPKGMKENTKTVIEGATVAKIARQEAEKRTGESIVSSKNAKEIRKLNSKSN